jgi:hypothetical protein
MQAFFHPLLQPQNEGMAESDPRTLGCGFSSRGCGLAANHVVAAASINLWQSRR